MGKADQYMDSLTYGLKLENMDQAESIEDWTENKKLKPCILVPSIGRGRGYIVYNNKSLSNFLPNSWFRSSLNGVLSSFYSGLSLILTPQL